ncbi:21786_t:CDS:2 [Gigaspora margarita]|uniref:21786_t:CDS:1 n=1 Tax=Gigaspora margarita TaxID=4874 RepID=A0ABN7VPY7_GIGMA|nr:21786_t:CDS:2 [Gigaspora margarita]
MDTPRRKSRKPNKYLDEVGVVGRKTGITISGEVTKNADGLEDVDAFFEVANHTTTNVDAFLEEANHTTTNVDAFLEEANHTTTSVDAFFEAANHTITNMAEAEAEASATTNVDEVSMSLVTDDSPQETSNKKDDSRVVLYRRRTVEIRRSKRQRIKPLEFWRNERIPLIHFIEVIRVPRSDDNESGVGRNTKRRKRNSKNTTLKKGEKNDDIDEVASAEGLAIDWETNEKITRRLIYTLSMYQTETIDNDGFKFQKTFSEGDFFSAGLIDIPKGRKKSGRNSNESAMVFFVFKGSVTFHLDTQTFTVKEGNMYCITNPSKSSDARLFFAQAKK